MSRSSHMKHRRGWNFWQGCVLVLVVVLTAAPYADVWAGEKFHSVRTTHYVVESDISPRFTRLVSQHMEEIYQEYRRRFREYNLREHSRFLVRVYRHRGDYENAIPPSLKGSAGAFISDEKMLAACRDGRTAQRVFETLYHEGFHQFLYSCIRADVPLWVNEGFAEYFAESMWNGKRFVTGKVPARRLMILKQAATQNRLFPFKKLFLMKSRKWLANVRKGEASVQYTQAWSIIHFLCHAHGGRHRPRLLRYLKLMSEGTDPRAAYQKCFGHKIRAFQNSWLRYVKDLKPSPESRCRSNMRVLMSLGRRIMDGPRNFSSLSKLHSRLLSDRIKWRMTTGLGRKIDSSDRDTVRGLFTCPRDQGGGRNSYIYIRNPGTGSPELYCLHHPGNVLRAYYEDTGRGLQVRVERRVKETLPRSVVREIKRKLR